MSNSNWTRFVPRQETDFDVRLRRSHDGKKPCRSTPRSLTGLTADKLNTIVAKTALTNQQRQADAISKADSACFLATHPEFINTPANRDVINKLLKSWNLYDNATFPDMVRAFDSAVEADLLDLDTGEIPARQKDHPITTFVGALTKRTYDNLDALIANERQFAIEHMPAPSDDEEAFADLPHEQALAALKEGERIEQHKGEVSNTVINGRAWMTLHPEYIDSPRNGKLMAQQLKANGVLEGEATIEDHERVFQQLSRLLSLKKKELTKQDNAELQKRAAEAVAQGGSIFDQTSEAEAETLSHLRNFANVQTLSWLVGNQHEQQSNRSRTHLRGEWCFSYTLHHRSERQARAEVPSHLHKR